MPALSIENLIWVVPGLIGLWVYNYQLAVKFPHTEGWAYLLAVVFFAFPYYLIKPLQPFNIKIFSWEIWRVSDNWEVLMVSAVACGLFGFIVASLRNIWQPELSSDPFHDNCILWQEKLVFITLDSKRTYLGTLIDHTKDIRFGYTIKIIPHCSGYRDEQGRVVWDFKYPLKKNAKDTVPEIVIPQSKIATFALWSDSAEFKNAPTKDSPDL